MDLTQNHTESLHQQGRLSNTLIKLHQGLLQKPIVTAAWLEQSTELAPATIQSGLQKLEQLNVIEELTGKQRDRVYAYTAYIAILNQGNELPE